MKRVLLMGDPHCGHLAGLTSPEFQSHPEDETLSKFAAIQAESWAWYFETVQSLRPFALVVLNGDAVDGKGPKSGGTEQLTTDRTRQIAMARRVVEATECGNVLMTFGTGYHTGDDEDWEMVLARELDAKIGSHEWAEVNGVVFDLKHHIGSSSIPHGRATAIARDRLWNLLWVERDEQPKAQVYVRSHVHYFQYVGGPDWLAMTLPALQAAGTKYGGRRMSGTVDYGFVTFDVQDDGGYSWQPHLARIESQRARAFTV